MKTEGPQDVARNIARDAPMGLPWTLGGKPATICGLLHIFAHVRQVGGCGSVEFSCQGIERRAVSQGDDLGRPRWYGIVREAYTRDCIVPLASEKEAEEWVAEVHESCDCED